jgi:hypothetical protein
VGELEIKETLTLFLAKKIFKVKDVCLRINHHAGKEKKRNCKWQWRASCLHSAVLDRALFTTGSIIPSPAVSANSPVCKMLDVEDPSGVSCSKQRPLMTRPWMHRSSAIMLK